MSNSGGRQVLAWMRGKAGHCRRLVGLDLRFKDPEDEAAYVESRARVGWYVIVAACAMTVFLTLYIQGREIVRVGLPSPLNDLRFAVLSINLGIQGLGLLVLALLRLRLGRFPRIDYELVRFSVCILDSMTATVGRPWNTLALQHGQIDSIPATVGDASDETRVLLMVDLIVTSMCVIGPARMHYLFLNVAFLLILYMVNVGIFGTPLEESLGSLLVLVGLSGFALTGAWQHEWSMRREWKQQQASQAPEGDLQGASPMTRGMRGIAERLCDLVLKLDSELCVCDTEKAHETFFGRPLCGEPFASCVPARDRDRFLEMLEQTSKRMIPHCISTTVLRQGEAVDVVILAVDTGSLAQKYLVGVRVDAPQVAPDACQTTAGSSTDMRGVDSVRSDMRAADSARSDMRAADSARLDSRAGSSYAVVFGSEITEHLPESALPAEPFKGVQLRELEELGRQEHWLIDPTDLRMTKPARVLGFGGYGQVIMGTLHGRPVAVKTTKAGAKASRMGALANELRIFRRMRHPNLIQFYGALIDQSQFALVFELVHGVELKDVIVTNTLGPLGAGERHCIVSDICCALWYLHRQQQPIVHGDIKPSNVMVEQAGARHHSKLIDFGLSTLATASEAKKGGTTAWAAPEASTDPSYRPKPSSDVFSFGWLMNYVWTGVEPYGGAHGDDLVCAIQTMIQQGGVELPEAPEGAEHVQLASQKLCQDCLSIEASRRPAIQSVHAELVGWLDQATVCDLGLDTAMALLPNIEWDAGVPWLSMTPDSQAGAAHMPIQVDLSQDLEIKFISKGSESIFGLDCLGKNFAEFLLEPGRFQVVAGVMRNDIFKCGACAPQVVHVSGVTLKARSGGGVWDASMEVFVPDTSGKVSIRILALHESRTLLQEGCSSGAAVPSLIAGSASMVRL